MAKTSQVGLLHENHGLNERLKNRQPLKSPRRQSTHKRQGKSQATLAVTTTLLDPLAALVEPVLRPEASLVVLDASGKILSVMGACCEALKATQLQMVGTRWASWLSGADRKRWQKVFADLDVTPIVKHLKLCMRSKDGSAEFSVCACRAPNGDGSTWLILDAPKAASQAHKASSPHAVAAHWAGAFAHELNQPLAAVLATAQACRNLLASGKVRPEEMLQGVESLIRRAHHAADVVHRLRTLAGREAPHRTQADLRDVVLRAVEQLKVKLDECRVVVDLDLPAVEIDSIQFVQVMVNLLRNANEALSNLPFARRQLTVRGRHDCREAIVSVEDQGVGLSADAIEGLFQPGASTKATGMGLGLALCRQIVEAHGGRIWAKKNSPYGCIFSFSIPLKVEDL